MARIQPEEKGWEERVRGREGSQRAEGTRRGKEMEEGRCNKACQKGEKEKQLPD